MNYKKLSNLFVWAFFFVLFINVQTFAQTYNFQNFPAKTGLSLEDDMNQRLDSQLIYSSKASTFLTWDDAVFKYRPKDTVFFTAINGRPCLAVNFSKEFLPDPSVIETIMKERVLGLSLFSFIGKGVPIIRAVFIFPDMPQNPLMIEEFLSLIEPDQQDFLKAAMKTNIIDLIIKHEDWQYKIKTATYKVKFDSPLMLDKEVKRVAGDVLNEFKEGTTKSQVKKASKLMYKTYASSSDGVKPYNTIWFKYHSKSSNSILKKTKLKK